MASYRFTSFLLVCTALVPSSLGFTTSSLTRRPTAFVPPTNTRLHQSSIPEEQPSWFELPSSSTKNDSMGVQAVVEDVAGRIAMMTAVGLIVGEVATGESVAEQFADALSSML